MRILPVVERELRVAARRPEVYWVRSSVAGIGIVTWLVVLIGGPDHPAELGLVLLGGLSATLLLLALLSGILLTADCISAEKRQGTLGLLFLTNLRSRDIVLGKLAAHASTAWLALLAVLPIVALPILTGGVRYAEILRVMLALLTALLLSLSLGIAISAVHTNPTNAYITAFALLLLIVAAPLLGLLDARPTGPPAGTWFSPVFTLLQAFDRARVGLRISSYWQSLILQSLVGFCCVGLAIFLLPRTWQQRTTRAPKARPVSNRRPLSQWVNPYHWLRQRELRFGRTSRLLLGVLVLTWAWALWLAITTRHWEEGYLTACLVAFLVHFSVKLLMALEATQPIFHEARNGELELLLASPLNQNAIVKGHIEALRRCFAKPVALAVALNLILVATVVLFPEQLRMRHGPGLVFSSLFIGGLIALPHDLRTIRWISIDQALRAPTAPKAIMRVLVSTLVVPWLLGMILFILAASARVEEEGLALIIAAWFGACAMANHHRTQRAKGRLRNLRELVCAC